MPKPIDPALKAMRARVKAASANLTPAQKSARTKSAMQNLAKITQERLYADAIVSAWNYVERMALGRMIERRGRKVTKKDEAIIAWAVKQAKAVRDGILAGAPEEMREHIVARYKATLKDKPDAY